jgi:hypothetical protein
MVAHGDGSSPPPDALSGSPVIEVLKAGTDLWRIHWTSYESIQFKPIAPKSSYEGGRFDALKDGDPYLYAGDSPECAIAEVWDRDIGPGADQRFISEATLSDRALSQIRTAIDLPLIDVSVPAASQFGQTAWFTTCDPFDYPHTRDWAVWLRGKALPHSGFVWRSRRDLGRRSYVFYERQLPQSPAFVAVTTDSVERGTARKLVEDTMLVHNAVFKGRASARKSP